MCLQVHGNNHEKIKIIDTEFVETYISSLDNLYFINEDLTPLKFQKDRGAYNFTALWIGISVCIPTYILASRLIAGGLNWWQALLKTGLGNIIVLIPMFLNF